MEFLPWTEDYEFKIAEIDSQHQTIVSLINRLYSHLIQGSSLAEDEHLDTILAELVRYSRVHFAFEENFFDKILFDQDEKDRHKIEHHDFCIKIRAFQQMLLLGDPRVMVEMLIFLKDWLKDHILTTDTVYKKEFFKHII